MKNTITCENCNAENPFHNLICNSCRAYLRRRIVNIDLWHFIWNIFESPIEAFREIVFAEHKNFIIFLTFLMSLKYFTNSFIINHALQSNIEMSNSLVGNLFLSVIFLAAYLIIFTIIVRTVLRMIGIDTKIKDIYSVYIFSFIPQITALFFLTPVDYALFGQYWFTYNPSPILVKPVAAYVLYGIEAVMIIWSMILAVAASYVLTKNRIAAIIIGIVFMAGYFCLMIFLPMLS